MQVHIIIVQLPEHRPARDFYGPEVVFAVGIVARGEAVEGSDLLQNIIKVRPVGDASGNQHSAALECGAEGIVELAYGVSPAIVVGSAGVRHGILSGLGCGVAHDAGLVHAMGQAGSGRIEEGDGLPLEGDGWLLGSIQPAQREVASVFADLDYRCAPPAVV